MNTLDVQLLSALFHAPNAMGILNSKTRALVGEVCARATNDAAYESLLINEEQLAAAQFAGQRARAIVIR